MPTAGGVWRALQRGAVTGCEVVQIFVKNNLQWFGKPISRPDLARFAGELAAAQLKLVFGHTGYLINLAAPASANRDKSVQSLLQEIQLASDLGLPFLVLHPGSHLGQGEDPGLDQVVAGLDEVFRATRSSPVRIALENTAGQGTCLGHRIPHLATLVERCQYPQRLGVCIDTAHLFAAGHDMRTPRGWNAVIREIETVIGLDRILAFHLNDSKTELGSRVDRHAGIGQGKIGRQAFRHVVGDPRFRDLPGCLETPKSADLHEDVENLAVLRGLLGRRTRLSGEGGLSRRRGRGSGRVPAGARSTARAG
jgi:deoxyribonuclease IV